LYARRAIVIDLFDDLTETALQAPQTDGGDKNPVLCGENPTGGRPASVGRSCGLGDVPGELRTFAAVPSGGLTWRAWTPGTTPAQAALEYRQRLGSWPAAVIVGNPGGLTLAGPVPDNRL